MSELNEALAAWGATDSRFIKGRENAVYEITLPGARAALRLHRVGYQSEAAIRSELIWMTGVAEAGLSVPAPIPALSGETVVTLSTGRLATVVSWVDGAPIGASGEPLPGSPADQVQVFHAVGREIARLHNVTDAMTLPDGFERHAWDIDGLLGDDPFWGRFWENPTLTADERALILRARAVAHDRLTVFQDCGGDIGLIHADALRENVFLDGDSVTLIDFDDAGFGFRMYDLAVLMSQNEGLPNSAALQDAAIAGYRSARPLPDDAVALLPMFIMLRRFASMGWIVPRVQPGEDWDRVYADRAVAAARRFLG
ncbi:phosphotransferase [Aliiroseovarius subalbicans]|uniref:phosphotransferase enzyme family protein n=1 Tax=Aliiroseovarius subalbicans TaxID=2925840 RepID=UPI001F57936B|nr:phosphotransferase [Aliiroseovarius subalbicans]MCI2399794.1 phosphotransferase [Aliiroseovarius subalbicans]